MPITVVGNSSSSYDIVKKNGNYLFEQKFSFEKHFLEGINEEYIVMKNQYRTKNLTDPYSIRETASKKYVDNLFNGPSIKNTSHVDCNNHNLGNVRNVKVTSYPAVGEHLTANHM